MAIYLSNIMIRFDDHSKLQEKDTFGIDGTLVDLTLIKSRINKAGQSVTLVFDQNNGFDPELSLLVLLKQHKLINGAGAHLYIGDRSDIKFAQKNFKQKLRENPELQQILGEYSLKVLKEFIHTVQQEEEQNNMFSITDNILKQLVA